MSKFKKIPVKALREFCQAQGLQVAVLLGWGSGVQHIVTWGKTIEQCAAAAESGNKLKAAIGWPESLHAEPPRVKKLQNRIKELEAQVAELILNTPLSEEAKGLAGRS